MPIFEFECRSCGKHFEELVLPWLAKPDDKPECPGCHGHDVERMLSICAVSSEGTRQASLTKARKVATKVHQEKEREEFRASLEHAAEHH